MIWSLQLPTMEDNSIMMNQWHCQEMKAPCSKDSKEKECPYSESDVPEMLDKLLEKGLIELPELSRPEEIRRTNDPKYCKYHRIISHPIEKCKAFRRQVLQFITEGKITSDEGDTEESYLLSIGKCFAR